MSEYRVVDTNVVSFEFNEHTLFGQYRPFLSGKVLYLCFATIAEMKEGMLRQNWGNLKRRKLASTFQRYQVIHSTPDLCDIWGWVRATRRAQPIASDDAWIAATALLYDCELVTHNPFDFRLIPGLRVLTVAE